MEKQVNWVIDDTPRKFFCIATCSQWKNIDIFMSRQPLNIEFFYLLEYTFVYFKRPVFIYWNTFVYFSGKNFQIPDDVDDCMSNKRKRKKKSQVKKLCPLTQFVCQTCRYLCFYTSNMDINVSIPQTCGH
jgi:hypothetical protein